MAATELGWGAVQPRYAAYCLAHGASTPGEMMDRDAVAYPGGKMAGYIAWITTRWAAWRKETSKGGALLSKDDHAAFDAWLEVQTIRRRTNGTAFRFASGATEVADGPALMREDPNGSDPHVLATIRAIRRPDELHELCALANVALALGKAA